MKELTDEILNKYIDNELSASEINELREFIESNPDELNKFKAHNLVDNILRELTYEKAPSYFTEKMMEKIAPVTQYYNRNNNFIKIILFVFALFLAGFTAAGLFIPAKESNNNSFISDSAGKLMQWASNIPFFQSSFTNENFLILFSSIILILFISIYILVNSHKHFKQEIENVTR